MTTQLNKSYFTISQVAERLGVTHQRVHQLIRTYNVSCEKLGAIKIISKAEMAKIPRKRPNGVNVGKKLAKTT